MATGWITPSKSVRERYADKPDVVRPGQYSNGLPIMGTTADQSHATARSQRYADGEKYREALRETPIRDNASVHSKNTKRYGEQGSKFDSTHKSTGQNPVDIEKRPIAASMAPRDKTHFAPIVTTKVGIQGGRYVRPSYQRGHTDGIDKAGTRASKGMAKKT